MVFIKNNRSLWLGTIGGDGMLSAVGFDNWRFFLLGGLTAGSGDTIRIARESRRLRAKFVAVGFTVHRNDGFGTLE